jgi:hypothetical protein
MYNYDYLNEKAKPYGGIKKIFDELSDYADEFIIGYLEARCGCKVSKEDVIKEAMFTSVWEGCEITTPCKVNTVTREIFDIEKVDTPTDDDGNELEILDREYVTVDGVEYCAGSASSETEGWNPDKDYWYK